MKIDRWMSTVYKWIQSNSTVLGIVFLGIVFHGLIERFVSSYVVEPFLSQIEKHIFTDILFIVLGLWFVVDCVVKRKNKYHVTSRTLVLNIVVSAVYVYYRFCASIWNFMPFSFVDFLAYTDVFMLYPLGNVLLWLTNVCKNAINFDHPKGFLSDTPLKDRQEDSLNREKIAKYLCNTIANTSLPDSSFAIGVSSKWGFGKTSFLHLIERNLNPEKTIVVKFNPWLNQNSQSIVKDFFTTLNVALTDYISEISPMLNRYAKSLAEQSKEGLLIPLLKNYLEKSAAKDDFEQINKLVGGLNRQLVVFIDDLDRLYKEEIFQVLKLIRNSANFGNTIFIVAYDRNYVVNAIKEINGHSPKEYLEKIFQLEIELPNIEHKVICDRIFNSLKPQLLEDDKVRLERALYDDRSAPFSVQNKHFKILSTLRDANRFVNSFLISYSQLKGEVVFDDLLNLELLRLKFSGVYKLLFFHTSEYLELTQNTYQKQEYSLKEKDGQLLLRKYLDENYNEVGIAQSDIDSAMKIPESLFPKNFTANDYPLSVRNPISFDRYSRYRLLEKDLSEVEFSNFRMKSQNEFQEKIDEWIEKGLSESLFKRLNEIHTYSDREDLEKIFSAIFYLARHPDVEKNIFDYYVFMSVGKKITDILNLSNKVYYLTYCKTGTDFKEFIIGLFKQASSPYVFESSLIYYLLENSYLVRKQWMAEFQRLRLDYLECYLREAPSVNFKAMRLFVNNGEIKLKYIQDGEQPVVPSNPTAREQMLAFIKKNTDDGFLKLLILSDFENFTIGNYIKDIFESFEAFEDYINQLDEDQFKYLEEFKAFFGKFKENDYKSVSFKFNVIPVEKK